MIVDRAPAIAHRRAVAPVTLPTARDQPFDPPAALGQLRDRAPLCRLRYPDGHVGWLVTSHALARAVLADARFGMSPPRSPVAPTAASGREDPVNSGVVIALDPPEHTRVRRLQTGHLTARRVATYRGAIERIVAGALDAMRRAGPPVDLVATFAQPVPSLAVCELLGVPDEDRGRFERPSTAMMNPECTPEEELAAFADFCEYGREVIWRKRSRPGEDLLSEVVRSGELTDDALVGLALHLFMAGHETTANQLALSVFALLREPARWETLVARPALIPGAVEELLRYLTIVQVGAFTRTALDEVELDGAVIEPGEAVTVSLSAANRDPRRFRDPDALDLTRDAGGHLAFGYGRHMCLGQHLARVELQAALAGLVRRFPTLRLAGEAPLHSGERFLYGVRRLDVTWR